MIKRKNKRTELAKIEREEVACHSIEEESFLKDVGLEPIVSYGKKINLCTICVNRPGLLFAGYDDYFAETRVQVIGKAEMSFLLTLQDNRKEYILDKFFSKEIPCLIMARGIEPLEIMIELAKKYQRPIYSSKLITSKLIGNLLDVLMKLLAPTTEKHGVLVDVFGTGILISGNSGIGKSETALELIHRGHRLVADDLIDLKNVNDVIYGSSPELIKHFMEIRGVGIIDVRAIYGVGSIISEKRVELLIELEKWDDNKVYERVGFKLLEEDILGVKVPKLIVPVMPGRNLAIVIEVATRDFRLKKSGYNSAEVLDLRMQDKIK